ncbi:TPA: pheST operon leader peptide PheM [Providencia stuartii]|nr:pheST operon leader peptide PheM [Providencia stuartii]MBS7782940.1 pheST operon leader peptide PheM [Providencia thailandensis]QPN42595.1 pheST operon leader peptide PheM [Providencia sp. 2.29]EMA3643653.1 pheST operon leader peptide PheM [Providencia stuartii]EMD1717982.1 pheST operon leader peptide PheM [Providencia stuartii]
MQIVAFRFFFYFST